jgi:predicted ATPase
LSSTRLLSLIGSGGTGKTRLSLQLAAELVSAYPDGVWFVELAPLADAALIPECIASVVGIRQQVGIPLLDLLTDYLRPKRVLLILDNCEHLVEACAKLADHFLHACPNLKLVVSSREALSIRGETVHRVPSLSLPEEVQVTVAALSGSEAVQLFLERAQAAAPNFALTDRNASYVGQICRRLDGIPLALELAAARVAVFSPDQIASRLDDRFKLLTGGGRTTVPRQQTLRATIDWSYEILGEPERSLLRRLAVFACSWTFEAAEALSLDLDVLDPLTQLVNKSLVITDVGENGTRYRLLESIRDYGRERAVQAGEWEDLRHMHLAYFAEFAELGSAKVLSAEVFEWLPRLRADYDNLRSALEWGFEHQAQAALQLAGALSSFWWRCGQSAEGMNWISQALARAENLPEVQGEGRRHQLTLREKAWYGIAMLAYLNDNLMALKAAEACAVLARELGHPRTLSICLAVIGWEQMVLGDNGAALPAIEESLNLARASGDQNSQGFALAAMAWYRLTVEHDLEAARLNETQSIALLEGGELSWEGLQLVFGPARGAMLRGEYAAARERFAKYLPLFERLGDEHRVNMIRSWLAHMLRYEGNYQAAVAEYRKTILVWQKLGHRGAVAHQLESFAFVAQAVKENRRAGRLFGAAEALREKMGTPMDPQERVEYDQFVDDLRGRLDAQAFASAWSAGRALTMEQAISYAITDAGE